MAVVRILGVDPGTRVVGFGCLELQAGSDAAPAHAVPLALRTANTLRAGAGGELRIVDCGVLRLGRGREIGDRLLALRERLAALLERLRPHELALEHAFHGKSAASALRIGEARGVVLAEAARAGVTIHQYAPARIKRCVTGAGDAGKDLVAAMVLQQLGGLAGAIAAAALERDATDALAVAFTRVEERRSPALRGVGADAAVGAAGRFWPRRRSRSR